MAKTINMESEFVFHSEKVHSVHYVAVNTDNCNATSVYVRKEAFSGTGSYPERIKLAIKSEG